MKYIINGWPVTEEQAKDTIREAVPNGGVEFLENIIRNCRRENLQSVTLHVGGMKKSIEIIFN